MNNTGQILSEDKTAQASKNIQIITNENRFSHSFIFI